MQLDQWLRATHIYETRSVVADAVRGGYVVGSASLEKGRK